MSTLSIVVCTRDRPESFERFVTSAAKCALASLIDTELVVVDASTEPLCESALWSALNDRFRTDRFVMRAPLREAPPLGPLRGYNRAFRECAGEYVAWFNDDCELVSGWDRAAIDLIERFPEVGLVAVYLRDRAPDGALDGRFRVYRFPPDIPHANFGVLRRELGERVGWFDERLGWGYGCDTSLGLRVIDAGSAVAATPACRCIHHRAWDGAMAANHAAHRQADLERFNEIWGPEIARLREAHARFGWLAGPEWVSVEHAERVARFYEPMRPQPPPCASQEEARDSLLADMPDDSLLASEPIRSRNKDFLDLYDAALELTGRAVDVKSKSLVLHAGREVVLVPKEDWRNFCAVAARAREWAQK